MQFKKILVLMSTYNGEKYLKQQIESVLQQSDVEISLLVRDDGSTDSTTLILERFENERKLKWYKGRNLGPAKSFMDLVYHAGIEYDYYAFCDQDDYWKKNKCSAAVTALKQIGCDIPAIYYCSLDVVDKNLEHISYLFRDVDYSNNYRSAILTGTGISGCTMVFNLCLLKLLKEYRPKVINFHDIWVEKVCVACGGVLVGDRNANIMYRQHGNNVVGVSGAKYKVMRAIFCTNNIRSKIIAELKVGYIQYMSRDISEYVLLITEYRKSLLNSFRLCLTVTKKMKFKIRIMYMLSILLRKY